MPACLGPRNRQASTSTSRHWARSRLLSAAILVALAVVPPSAAACSFAGPIDFVGHAVIEDLENMKIQSKGDVTFSDVDIAADCGIGNEMDVSRDTVALEVYHGVELYGLDGRRTGGLDLGPSNYGFAKSYPRLDLGTLYFVEFHDSSLNAMEVATGSRAVILRHFPAHDFRGYEVSGGRVAWVSFDGVYRFSVYDSVARMYLRENETVPGPIGIGTVDLELVAFYGDDLTLLRDGQEVYSYNFPSGIATLLLRLPESTREVAHHGSSVVFAAAGKLYLHDLIENATRVLMEEFLGRNLELYGGVLVYDYYDTSGGGLDGSIVPLALAGLAVGSATTIGFVLVRRTSKAGMTGRSRRRFRT